MTQIGSDTGRPRAQGLSTPTLWLFAIAGGLSVANIYYAQPLLDLIAADFHVEPRVIGSVVAFTQIGYALGLILIVPLGDVLDRRRLIVAQAVLSSVALVIVGAAPTHGVLLGALLVVGLLAVVVQVLVAFAADLAAAGQRGRAVGLVTSGVVVGILLARSISGLLADLGGWRMVYLASSALTLGLAALLLRVLPRHPVAAARMRYPDLLHSLVTLLRREPVLQLRGGLGFLIFATFSTLWSALVLPLSAAPQSWSHTAIGLFGLAGAAGAVAASAAGRLADLGLAPWTTGLSLAVLLASWGFIALLPVSLVALTIGIVLLDLAVQAVHVTNQSLIFAARPDARSRLVSLYMVFYALGSATGAIASTVAFAHGGWAAVCWVGSGFSAAALALWAVTLRAAMREPRCREDAGTTPV